MDGEIDGSGTTADMRMRTGLVVGLAVGYYFGTKAGRERYEQIQGLIDDFRKSRPYEKAQAAVELSVERVRRQQPNGAESVAVGG